MPHFSARIAITNASRSLALAGLVGATLVAHNAAADGVIRGTLHVPSTPATPAVMANPYPGRASSIAGAATVPHGLVTDAVISIEKLPAGVDSTITSDPSGKILAQRQQAFSARVLSCVRGTVVDFPNQDPIFHNVFSVSPVKRFDLGKYPKGHSKQVRFDKAGLVQVFCDIHPSMACFILVLPNRAFARPDADGAFALPALPAGTYTVKVWHPDFGEITRTARVPADGDVTLDLAY